MGERTAHAAAGRLPHPVSPVARLLVNTLEGTPPMPGKFIVASAALTAGLALTACGSSGSPAASAGPSRSPTAPATTGVGPPASAAAPGCLVQYRLWAS